MAARHHNRTINIFSLKQMAHRGHRRNSKVINCPLPSHQPLGHFAFYSWTRSPRIHSDTDRPFQTMSFQESVKCYPQFKAKLISKKIFSVPSYSRGPE